MFITQRISVLAALMTMAAQAHAAPVCPKDKAALQRYEGEYASTRLLENISKERSVPRAIAVEMATKPAQPYVVLVTTEDLYTSSTWHEPDAVITECVEVEGNTLRLKNNAQAFVRVNDNHADYFNALLSGCFTDETGAPWFFTSNAVAIGPLKHAATLLMDRFELPDENAVRVERGDGEVWFFRPLSKNGWAVFMGEWLADDETWQIDWAKPWRQLTPKP